MDENRKSEDVPVPFEEALNRTGNGLYNYLLAITCALILLAIGTDLFGFSLVVAAACDLNLTVKQTGILTSLPFVGILLVSYVWGYVSDTKGRRFALVMPLTMSFILACIGSLSPHWLFLGLAKFLSVIFSCAANSATYTLVGESCIQRVRSKYMLLMTCLLLLSPAMGAILAYPTLKLDLAIDVPLLGIVYRPWRILVVVLALPSGLGAIAIYFFYESPKFLFNCGRKEEALEVLKKIHAINHRGTKEELKVDSLVLEDATTKKQMSVLRAIVEQSAPLFRFPHLRRSLQLYYIVGVVYITNNSFLMWLPQILNLVRISMESSTAGEGNICSLMTLKPHVQASANSTSETHVCRGHVEDNVIYTLIISQFIFSFLNFVISCLPNRRKVVLLTILSASSFSGVMLNLTPETISSVIFFVIFTSTCLGMGILASFFVDLYPTSYRGMATCLSIMVGRSCAFVGINLVGNLIFNYCQGTFYLWSLLVFSSVVAAWFLPPDKSPEAKSNTV
ncbi:synaptic vesicle glycoprotein 2C [Manduca sexta]|uniref:Major facilitator superfamily (MFS) profile domain-containing protein n=1 Tax=Manduca sexta TaxID=7130 RepID=A0A921YYH0_MANSE|nr:synaptic vesicle glycoprotein 2C [Manduca sexta]KAG6448213.1 hypothetical protein O3G_MSEX005389 [Manduca sexta]